MCGEDIPSPVIMILQIPRRLPLSRVYPVTAIVNARRLSLPIITQFTHGMTAVYKQFHPFSEPLFLPPPPGRFKCRHILLPFHNFR